MNIIRLRGIARILFTALIIFNVIIPISCQTPSPAYAPVWDGVPGEFKAAIVGTPRVGDPFVVAAAGAGIPQSGSRMQAVLIQGDRQINRAVFFNLGEFSVRGPVSTAVLAVPVGSGGGRATLRIEAGNRVLQTIELTIEERTFPSQTFNITSSMVDIITTPSPERRQQAEQMWAIWARTGDVIYTLGNFVRPVISSVQTSAFGLRRTYRYPDGRTSSSLHEGIDWRAPTGTLITAPAPGRVVLAMNRIVTGNSVVIEHMPGVYSLYYHMDSIAVSEGELVRKGMLLGESGATGFATGAHLHFEIRVATVFVDPDAFIGKPILDKEAILAILNQ